MGTQQEDNILAVISFVCVRAVFQERKVVDKS